MNIKEVMNSVKVKIREDALDQKIYSDAIDEDGNQYIDIVMEGGGVLGVALIGYLYTLEEAGIRFGSIGGTSAGSIAAMLLAASGAPSERKSEKIIDLIANMPISSFVDGKQDGDNDPRKFIDQIMHYFKSKDANVFYTAFKAYQIKDNIEMMMGLNRGNKFQAWMESKLNNFGVRNTSELYNKMHTPPPGYQRRIENNRHYEDQIKAGEVSVTNNQFGVITADVSSEMRVEFPKMAELYWDDLDNINPAIFVRCSMSIPLFFKPYKISGHGLGGIRLNKWNLNSETKSIASSKNFPPDYFYFVDGGVISNFPIDIFHKAGFVPTKPTFGVKLQLDDRLTNINNIPDYLAAIFDTARHAIEHEFIKNNKDYTNLVSYIDTGDVGWLNFDMGDEDKTKLFTYGTEAALAFLRNFKWDDYKDIRKELLKSSLATL
ncbi:patatin-like phospholipase family protein [Aeromonas caviae]|uniref:patatin-like phospholipase family protein n=1 Tax=Aeromonas caviae TaxID=648 RepID=UPI0029D8F4D7|nr:patatin-like phospholipase family protein [Aeromonas caviae]MDX7837888.1 patatin-like phospholipase family protein [Aeromonas caviae]MDY7785193.1 patatin-like phospholipase family protein [Aeromonas caviae]